MFSAVYKKVDQKSFANTLQFSEEISKLMEDVMKSSNPASQLENMIKYGFNLNNRSVPGTQDIMRHLRRKKLEEMRKNISGTYENEVAKPRLVKEKEMSQINSEIRKEHARAPRETSEEAEKKLQDLYERTEMLSNIPSMFKKDIETLKTYDQNKNFLSQEAKQMFDELMDNLSKIEKLSNFLRKHPYGFNEGPPLEMDEAMRVVDRFEKIEEIENKIKEGAIRDVEPEAIRQILGDDAGADLEALQKILEIIDKSGCFIVEGTTLRLTPKTIRKIGYKILKEIFSDIKSKVSGNHEVRRTGNYEIDYEEHKKWEFGDISDINIFSTLKNAITNGRYNPETGEVHLSPEDFELYRKRHLGRTSTALLIDTSWSMSWGNKFECAKKVAIALYSLTSSFFPNDTLYLISFFTMAMEIKPHELFSIELNMNEPFTNMQDAIRLARRLLKKSNCEDKQIIMVTDGQPTAYCVGNRVFVEWPVMGFSPNAMRETLKEVQEATKENIKINVFMVDENPQSEKFVEEIVKINRGKAFFTRPESLGKFLILDFMARKRVRMRF